MTPSVLGKIYEGVWWVVGDDRFDDLCRKYIASSLAEPESLVEFGQGFSEFLRVNKVREAPYLYDLARFEWLFSEVLRAPTSTHFDHSELNILQKRSDVSFKFQPHMRLFSAPYAVYEMWTNRKNDPEAAGFIDWDKPEHLIVFKRDEAVFVHTLEPADFRVLELLEDGATFQEAVRRTAILFGDLTEAKVSSFFSELVQTGVISGVACTE